VSESTCRDRLWPVDSSSLNEIATSMARFAAARACHAPSSLSSCSSRRCIRTAGSPRFRPQRSRALRDAGGGVTSPPKILRLPDRHETSPYGYLLENGVIAHGFFGMDPLPGLPPHRGGRKHSRASASRHLTNDK
jgi:hypothetical protein